MSNNTSSCPDNEIPDVYQVIHGSLTFHKILLVVASVLTVITTILFAESVYYVRNKIPAKLRRNKMIWVLGLYPVFSITSCISLFIPRAAMMTNFTASIYLSVTLYMFVTLIIDYYGGSDAMHQTLRNKEMKITTLPLLCCCLCIPSVTVTERTGRWLRRAVLQVAIIRPLVLFAAVVLWVDGKFTPGVVGIGEPYLWISIISITSTLTAIQAISILHGISKEPLKDYKITFKFLSIQLTLIFGNVQLGVLTTLSNAGVITCTDLLDNRARVYYIYNFLIICEFFLINIFSRLLFRTRSHGNLEQVMSADEAIEAGKSYITSFKTPPNSPYLVKFSSKNEEANGVCNCHTNGGLTNVAMEKLQNSEIQE
ncbi:organic solute transporter subunit alpha-like [Saccoglossus kowalevskii]|uniref:Organic solute transporter subunit alpha-like n=1 Tax=Saccoglossus kowalevskii TaxID=10224 RepID=A0ABM0M246_SACKO|nr:PREDICTED: organic solute transporter subunit alpha-like [Saccoglossus kowalevskii]